MLGHIAIIDINEALPRALPLLLRHGKPQTAASVANARPTIEWPGLFVTEYTCPMRNVLYDPVRDANPFFHYLEAMWILQGRNDVAFLAHVLPRVKDFSDGGKTFHASYGHRLRHWQGADAEFDQIEFAIQILRDSPASRQVVMGIWDPDLDLGHKGKDLPCNDTVMLKVREGRLNITVANRSNDAIWGCYGANAVQFSMLQMYMAARIGVGVGTYCQVSDSFHVYEDNPYWQHFKQAYEANPDAYVREAVAGRDKELPAVRNLFEDRVDYVEAELEQFFAAADAAIASGQPIYQFARSTAIRNAVSMWNALLHYRAGRHQDALACAWAVDSPDWATACREWLERRIAAKAAKE